LITKVQQMASSRREAITTIRHLRSVAQALWHWMLSTFALIRGRLRK
uniref:IS110 family transposase n=1 Tax=Gongylonema pulchrum TaxID=637853 RepID=A0A183ETX1_9BILA